MAPWFKTLLRLRAGSARFYPGSSGRSSGRATWSFGGFSWAVVCAAFCIIARSGCTSVPQREEKADWLDYRVRVPEVLALLRLYPAGEIEAYPVSRLVNAPINDRPECIVPL